MEGKFDGMYMIHLDNKHDEWSEEKEKKREAYKKVRYQRTRDCKNSTGNSGSGKSLTLSSQINSALMSKAYITIHYWNLQPFKLGVQDEAHPRKWLQMIYYFICFPILPGLTKCTFQQGNLSYKKEISVQDG